MFYSSSFFYLCTKSLQLFTGIRNAELVNILIKDVDLERMKIRIVQGKGRKDRYVLFPPYFRGEMTQYISIQKEKGSVFLFESNRNEKYTTRMIREIVKKFSRKAGIDKHIHPHLFRHQILTFLTSKGIIDSKVQLISGHKNKQDLNIYQDLSLADIEQEYFNAMKDFPIQ